MPTGTLYLIPVPVVEGALHTLPPEVLTHTATLGHYVVENARTARRFLRTLHATLVLEPIQFFEIDKFNSKDTNKVKQWLKAGKDVGVMSEAGCPAVADPGAVFVAAAHSLGAKVVPLTGPSSMILALMASGLNGQSFAFNGYLPIKDPGRGQRIKQLEAFSQKEKQTQFFIETPYRNNQLFDDIVKNCDNKTQLCVALNVGAPNAFIKTLTVGDWKKQKPALEKAPAVFLILA